MTNAVSRLLKLSEASVSPYHAALSAAAQLEEAGFIQLPQTAPWRLQRGGAYYTVCFGTTLIAFTIGSDFCPGDDLRVSAAHIDWPCLHIKPSPEQSSGGCCKLNIEPYGGMIFSSWMDRPLSVAGTVVLADADPFYPTTRSIQFTEPLLTIPNLAIHMNRDVNRGTEINANRDMQPLLRTVADGWSRDGYFLDLLANRLGVDAEDILSYDLCVYCAERGCLIGAEQDLLSAPRLDNLTSVSACLYGIIEGVRDSGINVAVLYDHEEIGSKTKQGADSTTLSMLLEKISLALDLTRAEYLDLLMSGMLLSCDVAHAVHPNHAELSDASCRAYLNRGVVLKMNHNQRYPTDAAGIGRILGLCRREEIPHQCFMNRADLAGGGTIGAYASSQLGMCTIDCGVPILAMHSARELMGVQDQDALERLIAGYYAG